MWNLLLPAFSAVPSLHPVLAFLQVRTPTNVWEMVVGGTWPTKVVLTVLAVFSLVSWWLIFWKWKQFRLVSRQGDRFLEVMEKAQTLEGAYKAAEELNLGTG